MQLLKLNSFLFRNLLSCYFTVEISIIAQEVKAGATTKLLTHITLTSRVAPLSRVIPSPYYIVAGSGWIWAEQKRSQNFRPSFHEYFTTAQ